jgi:hypothetical protein
MPSWDTANKSTELSDYSVCTEAPWLPDYVNELTSFPGSRYDDQVDSTAQTLQYVEAFQDGRDLALPSRNPVPDVTANLPGSVLMGHRRGSTAEGRGTFP